MADDDEKEHGPWEKFSSTAVAEPEHGPWEKFGQQGETSEEEPTEENLPGSTEHLRSAVSSGVAKMQPPTKFEEANKMPEWGGFTPSNLASNLWRGGKEVVGATGQMAKDLLFSKGKDEQGQEQYGLGGLVGMSAKGGWDPSNRISTLASKYIGEPATAEVAKAKEELAKGHTLGAIGHAGAAALPILGPNAADLGEQIGAGDIGGGLARAGGQLAGGEMMAHPIETIKAPLKLAGKTLDALGNPLTLGASGTEMLTKGVRPRARATGWQDAVQSPGVQRAIQEYHAETPIKGVEDFKDAVPQIKERLWDDKIQPALDRQGPRPVDMKPVAEKVRRAITPQMREFDPNGVQAMEDLATKLEKSRTVSEASELNKYANAQLESYFNKYPTARRSALASQPETMGWENARSAIREQLGKTLEDAGEIETQPARKDYGHLTAIEKELERKVNVNDRSKPTGLYNFLGSMGGIGALLTGHGPLAAGLYGLGKVAEHFNSPDVLVRRGIARLNPPEAPPFTPPAPFVPPAAPAQIPRMAGEQEPLNLPPENAPLFNIQQSPRVPPAAPEEPGLPPIQGVQQSLPLPPENAPLFNIQQTPRVGEPPAPIAPPPEGGALPPIGGPGREGVLGRIEPSGKGQGLLVPPEATKASAQPTPPPGPRWTPDRGAMPGEPELLLDMPEGGEPSEAKAAIVQREDPREPGRARWEVMDSKGESQGLFSTPEEAAAAAEKRFPAETQNAELSDYAKTVIGNGDVKEVKLVGSTATGKIGRDTDIVYDFGKIGLPETKADAEAKVEKLIESSKIDTEKYDSFIKADDRYFHISSGAGRSVVENTEYGKQQASKPSITLAGGGESSATGLKIGAGENLGEGLGTEHIITKDGKRVGSISIEPKENGKTLHIHWLGGEFGRELKPLLMEEVERLYPDAERFTYDRRRLAKGAEKATTEPREMKIKKMTKPRTT